MTELEQEVRKLIRALERRGPDTEVHAGHGVWERYVELDKVMALKDYLPEASGAITIEQERDELRGRLAEVKAWFNKEHTALHQMIWGENGNHGPCPICDLDALLSSTPKALAVVEGAIWWDGPMGEQVASIQARLPCGEWGQDEYTVIVLAKETS